MPTPSKSRYHTYIRPFMENKILRSYSPYIFSLVTGIILIVFAVRPTVSTILNLQKQLEEDKTTLRALKKKSADLTLAKKNLENLDSELKTKIVTALPESPNIPSLVGSLQNSLPANASTSAIQIQPVTLTDTGAGKLHPATAPIDFTFNIQGSYSLFISTLTSLLKSNRSFNINTLSIGKQPDGPALMTVNGKAYYLK